MSWWRRGKGGKASTELEADVDEAALSPAPAFPRADAILLGLAGATVAALGMYWIRGFLAPVLLALVLTICVHPLRRALERWGVKRGLATGSVIAAVFLLLAGFVAALVIALAQFTALLPQFQPQLQEIGKSIGAWLQSIGFDQTQVQAVISGFNPSKLASAVTALLGSVASLTFAMVVILTCLILMALDASVLGPILRQVRGHRPHLVTAMTRFAGGVRKYMVATTGLGIAQGLLNWAALAILQVPGAFLWGMLSFLCSFIPNVGYFIAIIPPLVFGLLTGGWPVFVAIIIFYGIINALVQSVVQPRVIGNAVALSQTLTFISVLFWALVLGALGAILAVPLTLMVRTILIDSDPRARWWRPILGDYSDSKPYIDEDNEERKHTREVAKAAKAAKHGATPAAVEAGPDA